ncbi:DUF3185 family protein [Reinekea thalattae]|uniref:DUF3185 family protein n=1 Tax=Reinekea thalattae TaxID=2593301 RepID=A0A5C8ZC63_9GAMM|nr:DUF3185 family protein [Reinekea thalattae]TXR54430.1 DUF3185 family protein [Reinekea thalattae]
MKNKYIGIILIVIGTVLAYWGYQEFDSAGSQFNRALGGDISMEALVGLVGGAVCIVVGIFRVK